MGLPATNEGLSHLTVLMMVVLKYDVCSVTSLDISPGDTTARKIVT